MKAEDIEKLKDICYREGFELVKSDGKYYIEQLKNRVIYSDLKVFDNRSYFSFNVSNQEKIKRNREEIEAFLTNQLEEYLNPKEVILKYHTTNTL
jgi:hypothetical protein